MDPTGTYIQKPVAKTVLKTESVREHLTHLQTWDLAENQTLEKHRADYADNIIQKQIEMNQALTIQVQQEFPPALAEQTAPGTPVQTQVPAAQTSKQKKADLRHAKKAKKRNSNADLTSYHMVSGLKKTKKEHLNSMQALPKSLRKQITQENIDTRVLTSFCHGHKTNVLNKPANDEEAFYRQRDLEFCTAYASKDLEQRRPYLDRMVSNVLSIQLTKEMFTPEYLEFHAGEMREKCNRLTYFENVMQDPVNKPYFDALPKYMLDLLNSQVIENYSIFGLTLSNTLGLKAVNLDSVDYLDEGPLTEFHENNEPMMNLLGGTFELTKQRTNQIIDEEIKRRNAPERERLIKESDNLKKIAETHDTDIGGLNLTGYVTGYSFEVVSKYRSMIESNPEPYNAERDLIDKIYQKIYRGVDSLGDLNLLALQYQAIKDEIPENAPIQEQMILNRIIALEDENTEKIELLGNYLSSYTFIMNHLLLGKPLNAQSTEILRRLREGEE